MKLYFIAFTFLQSSFIFSQIGVNTSTPSEALHINGTIRIEELPKNETINAISTKVDGTKSEQKDQKFQAINTVVADSNGVLGVIKGVPTVQQEQQDGNIIKNIIYSANTAIIDNNVISNSLTRLGNVAVYLDARLGSTGERPIRFCLLNGIRDNVIVNQLKLGSGGGTYGKNHTYFDVLPNPAVNVAELKNSVLPYDSSSEIIWHKIDNEKPNIGNRDFIMYIISLVNTKEIYRLTATVNGTLTDNRYETRSDAQVTFFLERLSNND